MASHDHAQHTIHRRHIHHGWDNSFEPKLRIAPGETVHFETVDASSGQLNRESTAADLVKLDLARVNPVTGPVYVDGAKPGDALKVTVLSFAPSRWGWTGNIPGFGLLTDQFPDAHLHHWQVDPGLQPSMYGPGGRVPLKPMCGTIGVALAEPGLHSVIPPRQVGGNMDVRDIAEGTELWLPVEVAGALFSVGDTHAAQGDGEVCGTAVETAMKVSVRVDLIKGANFGAPRYELGAAGATELLPKGFYATTGVAPDLLDATKDAIRAMIDHLGKEYGLEPQLAYALCSVAVNLRISEVVDAPNWVVSAVLPRHIFV